MRITRLQRFYKNSSALFLFMKIVQGKKKIGEWERERESNVLKRDVPRICQTSCFLFSFIYRVRSIRSSLSYMDLL